MRREQSEMFESLASCSAFRCSAPLNMTFPAGRGVLANALREVEPRLLRACPSRRSRNSFFRDFLRLAHGIYVAAGVVGFGRRGARLEVREHLRVGALRPGCPIEFSQRRVVSEQRL